MLVCRKQRQSELHRDWNLPSLRSSPKTTTKRRRHVISQLLFFSALALHLCRENCPDRLQHHDVPDLTSILEQGKEPRKPKKKDKNSWSMKKRMLMGKLLMGKAKYSKEGRMEAKRLAQEMLSHQGYQPPSGPPQQGRRPPQGGRNQQGGRAQEGSSQHQKPEELHPSWAAKKRQSGMLGDIPTQGKAKKVVFED